MIEIDIDSTTSSEELADLIRSTFEGQVRISFESTKNIYQTSIVESSHNCSISTTLGGMVRDASDRFASIVSSSSKAVEDMISSIVKRAGEIISETESIITRSLQTADKLYNWLMSQGDTVLGSAKTIVTALIQSMNALMSYVDSAIQSVLETVANIKQEMVNVATRISIRACEGLTGAIAGVGSSVGIENEKIATVKDNSDFIERNLNDMEGLLHRESNKLSPYVEGNGSNVISSTLSSLRVLDDLLTTRV